MRLIDLVGGEQNEVNHGATYEETEIAGLTCDSRRVLPGFLFAAIPGNQADGRGYIADAISRGAVAVLAPPGTEALVPVLHDDNTRRRYALMAARFHDRQPSSIAAVTGTNGKTSVVSFVRQIWTMLGRKTELIRTFRPRRSLWAWNWPGL